MHTDDVFIIQITGNLMQIMVLMNSERSEVLLSNGTLAKNIFRQVVGLVVVGAGVHMEGILLVKTDVLFTTLSSLNGRVFAQTACNLQMSTATKLNKTSVLVRQLTTRYFKWHDR